MASLRCEDLTHVWSPLVQVSAVRTQMAELRTSLAAMNAEVLIATGVRPGSAGTGGGAVHEDFGAAMGAFYAGAMAAFRQAEVRTERQEGSRACECLGFGLHAAG